MAIKYSHSSHLWPSKIYPKWDFWFENKPSGNPAVKASNDILKRFLVTTRKVLTMVELMGKKVQKVVFVYGVHVHMKIL
jgi:hypothetical protein